MFEGPRILPDKPPHRQRMRAAKLFVDSLGRAIWKEAVRRGILAGAQLAAGGMSLEDIRRLLDSPQWDQSIPVPADLPSLSEEEAWGLLERAQDEAWQELDK